MLASLPRANHRRELFASLLIVFALLLEVGSPRKASAQADPLPSWAQGSAKSAILSFIDRATDTASRDFVPESERIAVFDNDGTLWSEKPFYVQLAFALDRVRELARANPSLADIEPYKTVLKGDATAVAALGQKGLLQIVAITHAGIDVFEFERLVREWIVNARHPRFDKPYTELVYQPMLELLAYMRSKSFKTYIISGGGIEFMRPWAEAVYGIPPEQVVGSSIKAKFKLEGDHPGIDKLPEIDFIDDGPGKPVGIHRFIGRRPVFAAGNSDGDLQMLQWTTLNTGVRFALIIHHTDAEREWAYDRSSSVGRLDKVLDEAQSRGWIVVDMKNDWKTIFPPGK